MISALSIARGGGVVGIKGLRRLLRDVKGFWRNDDKVAEAEEGVEEEEEEEYSVNGREGKEEVGT